jgi:site-specific recombinase XerD
MGSRRVPLQHPLAQLFQRTAESLTTSLGDSSIDAYQSTVHLFLTYLTAHHPQVSSLEQLRRDPHILGWLTHLRSRTPSLARYTMIARIVRLRRVLEELAWTQQLPTLAHLLGRDDIPRRDHHLPRPLTPDQDQRIQQELRRRDDFTSNALLLLRHTGMRIGECVDLSVDCLRPLGPNQWIIHVPLGKLGTERWVPVDSVVCQIIDRLRSLRLPPTAPDAGRLLLPRPRGRYMLTRKLRAALQDVAATAGITARIVPHQFRHTYATEMLRAGVGLPAVMKLLGHKSPRMTLYYLEITQQDLQREYRLARSHPRHLAPPPRVPSSISMPRADLAGLIDSLHAAQHVLEMFRRSVADTSANRILGRLANRLIKIVTEATNLNNLKTPGK